MVGRVGRGRGQRQEAIPSAIGTYVFIPSAFTPRCSHPICAPPICIPPARSITVRASSLSPPSSA
eukprot:7315541-Lingulodinium_polyedra.AAC.1